MAVFQKIGVSFEVKVSSSKGRVGESRSLHVLSSQILSPSTNLPAIFPHFSTHIAPSLCFLTAYIVVLKTGRVLTAGFCQDCVVGPAGLELDALCEHPVTCLGTGGALVSPSASTSLTPCYQRHQQPGATGAHQPKSCPGVLSMPLPSLSVAVLGG